MQPEYCSLYMHMPFVLTRTVETLHEANSTFQIFLLIHAYFTDTKEMGSFRTMLTLQGLVVSLNSHVSWSVLGGTVNAICKLCPNR